MAKHVKTYPVTLEQIDIDIVDQHNQELANPGRSAALRHIIREWASRLPVTVPILGTVKDEKVLFDDPQQDSK